MNPEIIKSVLVLVDEIPAGRVVTYGQIVCLIDIICSSDICAVIGVEGFEIRERLPRKKKKSSQREFRQF